MKKTLLAIFCMIVGVVCANAQSSWNEAISMFEEEFNGEVADELEDQLEAVGIETEVSGRYNASAKEFVMDVRFEQTFIWEAFDSSAMKAAKDAMVQEYKASYNGDSDFRNFINLMKNNGAKFRVTYSAEVGGKVKNKEFTITPAEIMK